MLGPSLRWPVCPCGTTLSRLVSGLPCLSARWQSHCSWRVPWCTQVSPGLGTCAWAPTPTALSPVLQCTGPLLYCWPLNCGTSGLCRSAGPYAHVHRTIVVLLARVLRCTGPLLKFRPLCSGAHGHCGTAGPCVFVHRPWSDGPCCLGIQGPCLAAGPCAPMQRATIGPLGRVLLCRAFAVLHWGSFSMLSHCRGQWAVVILQ